MSRVTDSVFVRKQPKQARSTQLVKDVLEAATQVLSREGARCFTTSRVAEAAGVSVGSLYQYFPNKEAILFRLQTDEWQATIAAVLEILGDDRWMPFDRLRLAISAFLRSECDEAPTAWLLRLLRRRSKTWTQCPTIGAWRFGAS